MEETKKQFKLSEVIVLIIITLIIGFIIGLSLFKVALEKKDNISINSNDKELKKFVDNYNYIVNNYYGDLDKKELIDNAISGMIESIDDPYTTYIDEESSNTFSTTLEGSFEGIGVEIVNDSDKNIVVYSVIKGSPAEKAGVEPLDIIKSINGKSLEGIETSEFVSIVKTSENPVITLEIKRKEETITKEIKREKVTITSVESEIIEKQDKKFKISSKS